MKSRSLCHNQADESSCALAGEPQTASENYTQRQWFDWLLSGNDEEVGRKFRAVVQRDPELFLDKKTRHEIDRLKKKSKGAR